MNKVTNKNWLIYVLPILGFVATGQGALQFTNVTGILTTNSSTLNAVEYDGNDTFVAVGENSTTLSARFVSSLPWVSNGVPSASLSLKSVAYGANRFVAGGASALTFTTTNASTWTQTSDPDAFTIAVSVQGLAFNGNANRFAAVASFVNISSADNAVTSWSPATINNSVLIESFRGVTTLPGNGFAACGLRGDLRVSSDGGVTWNVSRPFSGGEPDLFGIAAGGGRVISVGNFGRVMVSGDGGANWTINTAPIGNTNNAVAFTGEEFIVVGNGGRILTGTNANASDWVTNATLGGNLRGVTFATTGKLKGVAAMVGDGGTVILGGTRPLAPVNPINQTNCEGIISLPLSVSIAPGPNNPAEAQTVDWYSAPTGGVLLLAGSTNFTFTNPLPANPSVPSNYLYYAEQRDLRTGFVSTNRTEVILTINPTPTVDVVANQGPYCNTNGGLAVNFSGPVIGTTFAWTSTVDVGFGTSGAGNIGAFTAINGGVTPVVATVTVTPTANGCPGTPSIFTVTVNPTPTVDVVANQGPYCNTNAGGAISFSGSVAGTTFAWTSTVDVGFGTSGAGSIPAFTATNSGTVSLATTVTVTPTANGCPGTPRTFTVTVNPTPTVNPVANQGPYCNTNGGLAINFSGPVAGTTFAWTSTVDVGFGTSGPGNIGAFTAVSGNPTSNVPVVATVTVTPTANGCPGTPSTFTVTVNPTPTVNPVANQGPYCNTNGGLPISFNGPVAGTTFAWTSTVNVGFGTSAAGNISAFIATNGGTVPVVATVTVTPTANGCPGTPSTFTVTVNPTPTVTSIANQTQSLSVGQMTSPVTLNGIATSFVWTNNNTSIGLGANGTLPAVGGVAVFGAFTATNSGTATITVTPRYSNVIDCVTAATTNFVITVVNPVEPSLTIQMLNSTNVVLEWVAHTNTVLLSATNLTPVVFWSTNGVYGAGTNRVTNSILFEPPSQFFRLTNAP